MLRLHNINKSYQIGARSLHVLKDLNLTIEDGEFVAIMGSSGSGKSTLLNILGILDTYDSGAYHLDETLIQHVSEQQAAALRNRFIGFVFQSFHLLSYKTAAENVALPLLYAGVPRAERMRRAHELLEQMELGEWADHLPSELSGGQQQRVAIARALSTNPSIILADEPTGALDSATSDQIMKVLEGVHAKGMTLVVVTHEPDIAERAQRTIRLHDGRVVSES